MLLCWQVLKPLTSWEPSSRLESELVQLSSFFKIDGLCLKQLPLTRLSFIIGIVLSSTLLILIQMQETLKVSNTQVFHLSVMSSSPSSLHWESGLVFGWVNWRISINNGKKVKIKKHWWNKSCLKQVSHIKGFKSMRLKENFRKVMNEIRFSKL